MYRNFDIWVWGALGAPLSPLTVDSHHRNTGPAPGTTTSVGASDTGISGTSDEPMDAQDDSEPPSLPPPPVPSDRSLDQNRNRIPGARPGVARTSLLMIVDVFDVFCSISF